jgi:hypothetical protein
MISLDFLNDGNNKTLNEFYQITDGKIILGGSSVLKINKIIDRQVGNLNLALNHSDSKYVDEISKVCELTFVSKQEYGLKNKTFWFKHNGYRGVLFVSEDLNYDEFEFDGIKLRVATVDNVKFNKQELVRNNDSNSLKHHKDIEEIEKFYGNIIKKTVI